MKIVVNIENSRVLDDFVNFLVKHKDFVKFSFKEDLNNDIKESLFEVMLMKKGLMKKKELTEFLDEL